MFICLFCLAYFRREKEFLLRLADLDGCTHFIAESIHGDAATLLLSPIGHQFCLPNETASNTYQLKHYPGTQFHICCLVDIVKSFHRLGIIHRDLKIGNIFVTKDGHLFVNDVGSAVNLGESAPFAGTLHFASDSALESAISNQDKQWKCSDDLESVIKFSFILFSPAHIYHSLKQCTSPATVLEFWNHALSDAWRKLIGIAQHADFDGTWKAYDDLKTGLCSLITPLASPPPASVDSATSASTSSLPLRTDL